MIRQRRSAKGGSRTPIAFRLPDPKSGASASSATFARSNTREYHGAGVQGSRFRVHGSGSGFKVWMHGSGFAFRVRVQGFGNLGPKAGRDIRWGISYG